MNRNRRYGFRFTLIELLAVVALISLLMAVGVPAFARMIRGSRVDDASRSIKLVMEQAQMRAAAERRYVAVIFPNGDVADTLKPYRLGGFRLAYVKKQGNSTYEFSKWVDGSDWSNAYSGAVLARIDNKNFTASGGEVAKCTKKTVDKVEGADSFKKLGGVKDDKGNSLDVGDNCALIFKPSGGTESSSKIYLLVSEAKVEGDDISYPAASGTSNEKTVNYKVLRVNNLTGRVEFCHEN